MQSLGELVLKILLDFGESGQGTLKVTSALKGFEQQTDRASASSIRFQDKLQNVFLRLEGLRSILSVLKSSFGEFVNEANKSEIALSKLENGLKNVGDSNAITNLVRQANELKNITPFDDEDIINAQAMLTTFLKSSGEIEILIPRILDLAAAYMQSGDSAMSLQQVAVMLGKVNEETIGTLRRVGVAFSKEQEEKLKSLKGTEQAIYLSQILDSNFKGMAETVGKTAAGKMKIFQNAVNDLKESLGSVIKDVLIPLIDPLKSILNIFTNLPTHTKLAALAIIALTQAWFLFNSSINQTAMVFSLVAAFLYAMPPNLRLAAGALMILTGAFIAFNSQLAIANVQLGGLPVILGLIITGIFGVSTALGQMSSEFFGINKNIDEFNKNLDEINSKLANLLKIDELLSRQGPHTAKSQSELNKEIYELAKNIPGLITYYNAYTGELSVNKQILDQLINSEKERKNLLLESTISSNIYDIQELSNANSDLVQEEKGLIETGNELLELKKNLIEQIELETEKEKNLKNALGWSKDAGVELNKQWCENQLTLAHLIGKLKETEEKFIENGKEINDNSSKLSELKSKFLEVISYALKTNTLSDVFSRLTYAVGGSKNAVSLLSQSFKNLSVDAIASILDITNNFKHFGEVMSLLSKAKSFFEIGNIAAGMAVLNVIQSIKSLSPKIKSGDVPEKSLGKSGTSRGEVTQQEKVKISQLQINLELIREQIELKTLQGSLDKSALDTLLLELSASESLIETNKDKIAYLRIENEIKEKIKSINDAIIVKSKEDYENKKRSLELSLEDIKYISNYESKLKKLRELLTVINTLKKEYPEDKRYYRSFKQNISLEIAQTEKQKKEKIRAKIISSAEYNAAVTMLESLGSVLSSSLNQAWEDVFGHADSLFEQFLQKVTTQIIENLIQTGIFSLLNFLFPGLGIPAGGFLSALFGGGAGKAFASGGLIPGSGNQDNVPALLTPGEFVIRKSRVSQLGSQFLQWLNGGFSSPLFNRFASGGLVPAFSSPVIREVPYIASTKISGSDLNLIIKRVSAIEQRLKL